VIDAVTFVVLGSMRMVEGQAAIAEAALARPPGTPRGARVLTLLALAVSLAGCGGGQREPRGGSEPYRLSGAACLRVLADRQIVVGPWQTALARGCPVDTAVRTAAGDSAAFSPPLQTSCAMLVAWSDFEAEVDRAAVANLGSRVTTIRHFGSYACRAMTGNAGRRSLHARARAFDISGFTLADGRTVTVARGWRGSSAERRFLRAVATAACRHFSVTLTPNSDRFHQDHLHVDIGPWRRCGL
jgi:hypothetical protein